ncbi:hypothetical protein NL676_006636 [Syzygium grande]|nr:hypothetical protein NL676_006636 [Syzygium grande]
MSSYWVDHLRTRLSNLDFWDVLNREKRAWDGIQRNEEDGPLRRGGSAMDGQSLRAAATKMVARPWTLALDHASSIMDQQRHRPKLLTPSSP